LSHHQAFKADGQQQLPLYRALTLLLVSN